MPGIKEWTLMFYFAGDNALAPVIVSQLKAIKDAGFHENIDVLIHFDPNEFGVPTRIYDVNRERKRNPDLPNTLIGDGKDPFVRSLPEDDIKPEKIVGGIGPLSSALKRALITPDTINAEDALINFLGFCRESHRAKRYMLFLVGHGMVVGNDAFLPDDNPVSAITLKKLGEILNGFNSQVKTEEGTFELLALHSCSLSAIEVAYELKGTANYMMASEGPAFVGSYPYRQLLKKIFSNLEKAKNRARRQAKEAGADQIEAANSPNIKVPALVEKLYYLTLNNATDFLFAGYSHDLALCSLDPQKFGAVTESIQELVTQLKAGLAESSDKNGIAATERGKRMKELVLLAHWEAQSYWGENYTDLFDFCRCLRERCNPEADLKGLHDACSNVIAMLDTKKSTERSERFEGLVIRSDNFGSRSQYSHGLSIYFPWSRPIETVPKGAKVAGTGVGEKYEDEGKGILERYKEYAFTTDLGEKTWLDFLESYFNETQRRSRIEEDGKAVESRPEALAAAESIFNPFGPLSRLAVDPKPSPRVGEDCFCPSIKNYPQGPKEKEPKEVQGRAKRNVEAFAITEGALTAF